VIAAAAIALTFIGWAAGAWLGLWLNRQLKLAPWPGPRWALRFTRWSVRYVVFWTGFTMISAPATYLAYALLR